MNRFWQIVGVLLLGWAAWDIYAGYTLIWNIIYRDDDPVLYWIAVSAWSILGISCFFHWDE